MICFRLKREKTLLLFGKDVRFEAYKLFQEYA